MKFKKLLLLLPMVGITSCGYSLSYLVEGNKYNSPIFTENYYQCWNEELKQAPIKGQKEVTDFITSFYDIDKIDNTQPYDNIYDYGSAYKMNKTNDLFNYGVQSKLFDGIVECDGVGYQLLRVQTDEDGFSISFGKESSELRYIALQFKSTTNNQRACLAVGESGVDPYIHEDNELYHSSTITIHTSIYCKNDANKIEQYVYTSTVQNDYTNVGSRYIFYGFDLRDEKLSRVVGYSISYEYDDELINWNINHGGPTDIEYALFLYELFIPYTSWN